jgi:hypothetical protein
VIGGADTQSHRPADSAHGRALATAAAVAVALGLLVTGGGANASTSARLQLDDRAPAAALPGAATCTTTGVPQFLIIDSRGSGEPYPPVADMTKLDSELNPWPGGLTNTSLHDASAPARPLLTSSKSCTRRRSSPS